jgi:hypothetical protein
MSTPIQRIDSQQYPAVADILTAAFFNDLE